MDKQYDTDELLAEILPAATASSDEAEEAARPLTEEDDSDMKVAETTKEMPAVEEEEEDVKIFVPASEKKTPRAAKKIKPVEEEPEEEESGQLCFDDWEEGARREAEERLEQEKENARHEAEMEETLKGRRLEKYREFDTRRLRLTGDEEPVPLEEVESIEYEEEYVEDFCSYEDVDAIRTELRYRRARHRINAVATSVIEAILLIATFCFCLGIFSDPLVYIVATTLILGVMMVMNRTLLRDGWDDFRAGELSGDSTVLLCCGVAVVHTLFQLFVLSTVISYGLMPALAGMGLTMAALGKQLQLRRLCANFDCISREQEVHLAYRVDNEQTAMEIGRTAVAVGQPEVAYFAPVEFYHRFLDRSYTRKSETPVLKTYVPAAVLASAIMAVAYGCIFKQPLQAFYLFALCTCVALPMALPFSFAAAFWRSGRYALRYDGMVVSRDEADAFGDLNAVCVDAADLFPEDNVVLGGIKLFGDTRIDAAILDAAAVVLAAGGPLQSVFRQVIQGRTDLLKPVDTLVYEQEMGLSGWVGGRRVLVGNGKLLKNHNVDVPSRDYEMRYTRQGRKLVYLSVAGELSAMFVVAYTSDAMTRRALKALTREKMTLLIRTCDPNITEELVCETLELPAYYVEILGTGGRRAYEHLVKTAPCEDDEEAPALACDGTAAGKAAAVTACSRLHRALPLIAFAVLGMCVLGMILCALMAFFVQRPPSTAMVVLYEGLTLLVGLLVPKIFRT